MDLRSGAVDVSVCWRSQKAGFTKSVYIPSLSWTQDLCDDDLMMIPGHSPGEMFRNVSLRASPGQICGWEIKVIPIDLQSLT